MRNVSFQIVRHDRTMEQIVFPVPNICEFLTHESKYRVFNTTERDEQGSKVNDFFQQSEDLYNEMKWQKKIRSKFCAYRLERYNCGRKCNGLFVARGENEAVCLILNCASIPISRAHSSCLDLLRRLE